MSTLGRTTTPQGERPAPSRGVDGFYHPASEADLVALVRAARRARAQLRVRGSAHSVASAIYCDAAGVAGRQFDVMLDRYTALEFDDESRQVVVQAGCHLGLDPRDPTGMSTWQSSLLAQLDARGWALPDLGGVTHQTLSGYLATGSSGGTVQHAFEDAVVAYRLIDGYGRVHVVTRDSELFDAVGCSLGLLGVVSTITLQCESRYDVLGREDISDETSAPFDLLADGDAGLEGFFRRTEYARLMWWPQRGVRRIVTWQARRFRAEDYDDRTGEAARFRPKPYAVLGDGIQSRALVEVANRASQAAGGLFYDALAQTSRRFQPLAERASWLAKSGAALRGQFAEHVLPRVLSAFLPPGTQHFWDRWYDGLPMDNQMSEASFPTEFTELWLPLERTGEIMRALRTHFDRGGYEATGPYITEVYAARRTRGWLHPGYGRDSLRIDLFWFARNPGDPRRGWFVQFWELLQQFGYRLHWGKHLPFEHRLCAWHLREHTPRWDDFMRLRAELDPYDLFLTAYWRQALGLT